MRRKSFSLIALVVALFATLTFGLASCGEQKKPDPQPTPDTKVTVTWYNGTEELKTEKVEKGTVLESWTPVVEGKQFMAWYAEASKTTEFDFTKPVNEDTDIFAGFKGAFEKDTREWYLVGGGAGTIKISGWKETEDKEELKLVDQNQEGKNIFKIENVTLYAGDEFQVHVKGTWNDQHGVGYVEGYTEVTDEADENLRGVVKVDDVTYFKGNKGFGDSPKGWNIVVVESGVYTLELETFPGSGDYDVIRYVKTGEAAKIEVTHDMYIRGTISSWAEDLEEWKLTANTEKTEFTKIFTVTEAGEIKVHNAIDDGWHTNAEDGQTNMAVTPGDWAIKYTVEGNKVELQQLSYYVVGTFVDAEDQNVNFAVKVGTTPEITLTDGTGSVTLEVADLSARTGYDWLGEQGKGVAAFKVVYGCELAIRDWFGNGEDNFYPQEAGTYTLTFTKTAEGAEITLELAA